MWNRFWLGVNNWRSPYILNDSGDGVVWRTDKRTGKSVKAYDKNFVQGTVPTPKALDYAVYGTLGLLFLAIGALIGSVA